MVKKANPLAARIKRLMQKDQDVGKIAQATPVVIARAMELLLDRVCRKSAELVQARGGKTLAPSHIKACIQEDEQLAFLADKVAHVPDLPQGTDAEAPKPKRQRVATEGRKPKQAAAGAGAAAAAGGGGGASSSQPPPPPAAAAAQQTPAEGANGEQAETKATAAAAAAAASAAAVKADLSSHPLLGGAFSRFKSGSKPGAAAPKPSPQKRPLAAAAAAKAEPGPGSAQQPAAAAVAAAGPAQQQATPFGNPGDAAAVAAGAAAAPVQPQGGAALGAGVPMAALNSYKDLHDDFDDDYDS